MHSKTRKVAHGAIMQDRTYNVALCLIALSLCLAGCAGRYIQMPEPNAVEHSVRYYPRSGNIEIWSNAARTGMGKWFEYVLPYNMIQLTPEQEQALRKWVEENRNAKVD